MRYFYFALLIHLISACQPKVAEVKSSYGQLSFSSSYDFGLISNNLVKTKKIELRNIGGAEVSGLTIELRDNSTFKFTGDEFPGITGSCPSVIGPGDVCLLEIEMKNTKTGSWSDVLSLSYYDTITKIDSTIELIGRTGIVANLVSDLNSYLISPDEPNRIKYQDIFIRNKGILPAQNLILSLTSNTKFKINSSDCPNILNEEMICKVVIRYESSELGVFNDTLTAKFQNGETNRTLFMPISATTASIEAHLINLTYTDDELPQYLDGQTFQKKFRIENSGFLTADIQSISFDDMTGVAIINSCLSSSNQLAVDAVCEVVAQFNSQLTGIFKRKLQVSYFSGKSNRLFNHDYQINVNKSAQLNYYSGNAITSYDFGPTGIGEIKKFAILIKNEGDVILESSDQFTGLNNSFSFGTNTCQNPVYIFPQSTCLLEVVYAPTIEQIESNTISINYNNGHTQVSSSFVVSGTGVATGLLTKLAPSGNLLDFGEHRVGAVSTVRYLEMKNTGLVPISISSIGFNQNSFAYEGGSFPGSTGTCSLNLNVDEVCTIALISTGANNGVASSSITVNYHNGLKNVSETIVTMKATVSAPANLRVSNPLYGMMPASPSAIPPYTENAGFYGRNKTHNLTVELDNTGDKPLVFNSLSIVYTSGGPTPFTSINSSACSGGIAPRSSCLVLITFTPTTVGDFNIRVTANYNNFFESVVLPEHNLVFKSANLAHLDYSTASINASVVLGTNTSRTVTVTNSGTAATQSFSLTRSAFPTAHFNINHNCPQNIPISSTCTITILFNPGVTGSWSGDLNISYDNGGSALNPSIPEDINFHLKLNPIPMDASSTSPATLSVIGGSPSFNFGDRDILSLNSRTFTIRNSGGTTATITSCSGVTAPITTTCVTNIAPGVTSNLVVNFNPTSAHINQSYNQNLSINFNNGIGSQSLVINLQGNAVIPKSTHRGWRDVFANGSKTQGGGASVSFKWLAMTIPNSIAVSKYRIYRKVGSNSFNLSTDVHLAEVTNLANLSYTDNTVSDGTIYYYYVVPMIFTSHLSEPVVTAYSTLRVVTPPKDMSLVHRITANQVMCENILGLTVSALNWNRCSYDGPGSDGGFFDIVHDLVVDVFETNILNTNVPGQIPRVNMGQQTAWDMCRSKTLIFGGSSSTLQKRLLTRKEFLISSSWNPSFNNSTIESYENGLTSSNNCNDNGNLEASGNNTNCVSHFGLMDMFGNAWEWVADRMVNGMTASAIGRLVDIDDYENINFSTIETQQTVSGFKCLAPALGMPVPKNIFNACDTGLIDISTTPIASYRNDYFFSPTGGAQALIVGGSNSADNLADAGFYTSAWVSPSFTAGARCAFEITY